MPEIISVQDRDPGLHTPSALNAGEMIPYEQIKRSLRLLTHEVMPALK